MFLTTEEQEDFRQAVRQMCEDKVAPHAAECDEKAQYPWHAHEAVAAMTTKAERDGDEWVINGRKQWITNAGISDYYVVFAKTDRSAGHRGISCFVVEKDMPGFSIGKLEHKLGIRASPTGEVILE